MDNFENFIPIPFLFQLQLDLQLIIITNSFKVVLNQRTVMKTHTAFFFVFVFFLMEMVL